MKELIIISSESKPTVDQISSFESAIGNMLPNDYKSFLMNHNPKTTIERLVSKNEIEYIIYNWLPLSSVEELSIENTFGWTKDFLDGKYLDFALDAGDWLFVISINSTDYGQVFFCRPDQELHDGLTHLANSFAEFINMLEPSNEC